jgi:hypothetical protein
VRVTLDVNSGLLLRSPASTEALDTLKRTLGDPALDVALIGPDAAPQLPEDATLQFVAKAPVPNAFAPDFDGTTIVSGSIDIDAIVALAKPQIVSCGEDWKSAALLALFSDADKPAVNLFGQYRWRLSSIANWRKCANFSIIVANSIFSDDFVPSPAVVVQANRLYLGHVTSYVGADLTALDHNPIADLPAGTLLDVVVGLLSSWKKVAGTDVTNLDLGVIRTSDFDALLNPYVLVRVAGL